MEKRTRYFIGNYHGQHCFIKQYIEDPRRAKEEYEICADTSCDQIIRSIFRVNDVVGFEYFEGMNLSRIKEVRNSKKFLREFSIGLYEICNVLNLSSEYDFHSNNVLVNQCSSVRFIDFDLKYFSNQNDRFRNFLHESLSRSGVPKVQIWFYKRKRVKKISQMMIRKYL